MPFHDQPRRAGNHRPARQQVFDQYPGDRQPAAIDQGDHARDRLAGFGLGPVAIAGRIEVVDPCRARNRLISITQQGRHRAGSKPDVEDDRNGEDDHDDQKPEHQTMTLDRLVGTATVSSNSSTIAGSSPCAAGFRASR